MVIREDTPISSLVKAGIVPEWMYRDCDRHGMYEAENILCEFDWDWNWDLGNGYTKTQLQTLAEVRKTIKEGIEAFRNDKEAVAKYEEERKQAKIRRQRIEEYKETFRGIVFQDWIPWVVDYELKHGKLPYLFLICMRFIWYHTRNTPRQQAKLLMAGICIPDPLTGEKVKDPMPIEEVAKCFPQFSLRQLKTWSKQPLKIAGRLNDIISHLHEDLELTFPKDNQAKTLSESNPIWQNISQQQNLTTTDGKSYLPPLQIMRLISLLRPDYSLHSLQDGYSLKQTSPT